MPYFAVPVVTNFIDFGRGSLLSSFLSCLFLFLFPALLPINVTLHFFVYCTDPTDFFFSFLRFEPFRLVILLFILFFFYFSFFFLFICFSLYASWMKWNTEDIFFYPLHDGTVFRYIYIYTYTLRSSDVHQV